MDELVKIEEPLEPSVEMRIQRVDDDIVLETTKQEAVKTRVSEKELVRRRQYLTGAIARFETQLGDVNAQLDNLYAEAAKG